MASIKNWVRTSRRARQGRDGYRLPGALSHGDEHVFMMPIPPTKRETHRDRSEQKVIASVERAGGGDVAWS